MKISCKTYQIIILFTLIFIPDFGLSQKNVRLQFGYGNDYTNFIDVTDSSSVNISFTGNDGTKTVLKKEEKGFVLNDKESKCGIFEISYKRQKYCQKNCFFDPNEPITLNIGNTDYYFYRGLKPSLPIFPENIIYVEFDFGVENKFDTIRKYPTSDILKEHQINAQSEISKIDGLEEIYLGNGYSGYKIVDSLKVKEIIRKISNVKYVKTISPVYKKQTLLTNRVEFLVDKNLSDKDAKQLFRVIGDDITEIWENPTNSFIWNYKEESLKAKVYVVHFDNESLATYDFISKLNELMNNDKVLAIKMFSDMLLKLD